ncbi:MAG: ATPase [Acidobacteriota bacterium]|nr:ATPase [Acidobacteriota bacterium]
MAYFLALDAGGTKTVAVMADETRELARRSCGSVKLMRVGEEEATQRLETLLQELSAAAGVPLDAISYTCMGLAGLSIEAVKRWAEQLLGRLVGGTVELCGDEEIALDGAFRGGPGILVIAGTGSNLVGRAVLDEGNQVLEAKYWVGGWGPALGDEGSGYWIGQEAVRAGLWGRDRGVPSRLLEAVQEAWGVQSLGELVEAGNAQPGPDFAMLAPVVYQCAKEGDELATAVLERAGHELAEQVAVVRTKMAEAGDFGRVQVACTGSVLEKITPVRESMIAALASMGVDVDVLPEPADAIAGALWRARQA